MVSSLLQSEGRVVWSPPDGAGGCAEERGRGEQGGGRAVMELVVVLRKGGEGERGRGESGGGGGGWERSAERREGKAGRARW